MLALIGTPSFAGNTADQVINFTIPPVNEIAIFPIGPVSLAVSAPAAGDVDLTGDMDATTFYAVTTNEPNKKITAQITVGGAMPLYTKLSILLDAPASAGGLTGTPGDSSGIVEISDATAKDCVTGMSHVAATDNRIMYFFDATKDADVATFSRTVTLSLVDAS